MPEFEAGAHINIETPSGEVRSYSLTNNPNQNSQYVIAVKREESGRGGSLSMHENLHIGSFLCGSIPIQSFPLVEANDHLLIAGGIGITPILSMARQILENKPHSLTIVYLTRSPELTAYIPELKQLNLQDNLIIHHDFGDFENAYDLWSKLSLPNDNHVYCCGPGPLMNAVRQMTIHWPPSKIHFEDFSGIVAVQNDAKPFQVIRHSSGREFNIPADKSIIQALENVGIVIKSSCRSGTCGTCMLPLISGNVEHRDVVLSELERTENIMPCVSRAVGNETLILDF